VRTREALRSALLDLLEEKPFDQVTIRDIAATAGLGYVTFFRHHPTKEALLHEIAAEQVRRLSELMLPALEASDTRTACIALYTYVDDHRRLWSTLLTGGAAAILREELLKSSAEIAATRSDPNSWLPAELAVAFNVSCTIELMTWWLRQKRPVSVERVAQIQERIIINPIVETDKNWTRRVDTKRKGKR
jgi:AcrR family transcriptional regulator